MLWAEWNGKYRDTVRRYWKSDDGQLSDLAYRLTGSSDLYERDGRRPSASINFVTAHDGFTLHDLVSYNDKHNEANGEENRDGANDNHSWNMGVEGPTDDPEIIELRERQKRNFLATLLLSQGVPMICGGDEIGRDQHGNNNAYCQDNELTWFDWNLDDAAALPAGIHAQADPIRAGASQSAPPQVLPGPQHPPLGREGHRVGASRRAGDDRRGMDGRVGALSGRDAERRDARPRGREGRPSGRRYFPDDAELPSRADPVLSAQWARRTRAWEVVIDTNRPDLEAGTLVETGAPVELARQSLVLVREQIPKPVSQI